MEFGIVDLADILTLIALVIGPLAAAFWLSWQEKKNRQMAIFRTLWANRNLDNYSVLLRFESLNLVPVVFYGKKKIHDEIHGCWSCYMAAVHADPFNDAAIEKAGEKYKKLLESIAAHLGYQFSPDDLKSVYYPTAIQKKINQEAAIREGLVDLLWAGKPLPLAVKEFPQPDDS